MEEHIFTVVCKTCGTENEVRILIRDSGFNEWWGFHCAYCGLKIDDTKAARPPKTRKKGDDTPWLAPDDYSEKTYTELEALMAQGDAKATLVLGNFAYLEWALEKDEEAKEKADRLIRQAVAMGAEGADALLKEFEAYNE